MTVTTQTQEGVTVIKTTNSPTLESGAFDVVFSEYERVIQAAVFLESPNTSDRKYTTTRSISGNTVAVTIKKTTPSDDTPDPVWVDAETANVAGEDIVVVVDCI